jgi:hypothetical protein
MGNFVAPGVRDVCPHCGVAMVFSTTSEWYVRLRLRAEDELGPVQGTDLHWGSCPNCEGFIFDLVNWKRDYHGGEEVVEGYERVYPLSSARLSPPAEVPDSIRAEYKEAASIATLSPRGAAALARRCLQLALHDRGFRAKTLEKEIGLAEGDANCTPTLRQSLHLVRMVGNYAAHPTEDGAGSLLNVEPGEVEALFGALDDFFDAFYVRPSRHQEMIAAINQKLQGAGKPPIA